MQERWKWRRKQGYCQRTESRRNVLPPLLFLWHLSTPLLPSSHTPGPLQEYTNYHFDVAPAHLQGALDRLAQFFVKPLFLVRAGTRVSGVRIMTGGCSSCRAHCCQAGRSLLV